MSGALDCVGTLFVAFRDHSYRWVNVKRFRAPVPGAAAVVLLTELFAHPRYRDHYLSPDSETEAPIHGPYRLDAVTAASFDLVDRREAERSLREWVDHYPVRPDEIEGDLGEVFGDVASGTAWYRLRELGEPAQHDFGWVLIRGLLRVGHGQRG
jgi:hypothetical protein